MSTMRDSVPPQNVEWAWDVARLFPPQGSWTETDYFNAEAGIPEYWVIDPAEHKITVFVLQDAAHVVHGEYTRGDIALSVLLDGWQVDVDAVFSTTP